jgi:hypothetical protein
MEILLVTVLYPEKDVGYCSQFGEVVRVGREADGKSAWVVFSDEDVVDKVT